MSKIRTRQEFADYCLRRLGWPVIQINVDDDQISDRIDDALSFWSDYHFDGTEKLFMKHRITETDIKRQWIYCPEPVTFVTGIFPWDDSNSSINMFDLRYQLRLHDLYDFTSVSYVSYEITMQHIRTLNLLFSGTPQYRFNRKLNKIYMDIDWSRDVSPGDYVIVECYRKLQPDLISLTGTVTGTVDTDVLNGTNTIFDTEFVEGDIFTLSSGESYQIKEIISPTQIRTVTKLTANVSTESMTIAGVSDVWNDRFLKAYATAKIKYQWGSNLSKFAGIQMPGGITLDGPRIMQEAQAELDKLEEEMHVVNVLPGEIYMG